jgi:hypothetical protein
MAAIELGLCVCVRSFFPLEVFPPAHKTNCGNLPQTLIDWRNMLHPGVPKRSQITERRERIFLAERDISCASCTCVFLSIWKSCTALAVCGACARLMGYLDQRVDAVNFGARTPPENGGISGHALEGAPLSLSASKFF